MRVQGIPCDEACRRARGKDKIKKALLVDFAVERGKRKIKKAH